MNEYKIEYRKNGITYKIKFVSAKSAKELVKKYDLASKENLGCRITQISEENN